MKKMLSFKSNDRKESKRTQALEIAAARRATNRDILSSERLTTDMVIHKKGFEPTNDFVEKNDLKEINTALQVLLKKREEDRKEVEEKVLYNIQKLIFPYLDQLKNSSLSENQRTLLEVIETNLEEVTTCFSKRLSLKFYNLSKNEIRVANLIKIGKKTIEIAGLLKLSPRTIEGYRQKIRQKLRIQNKQVNLRTYLLSL